MRVSMSFLGILRDQIGQKSLQVDLPDGAEILVFPPLAGG